MPTQRIPLAGEYNNREASAAAGGKDLRLVNCYTETIGDKRYVVKRPGLKILYQVSPGTPQGVFSWGDNDYFVVGGKLYKNGNQLTDSDLAGLSTTSQVDFTIGKDSAGNEVLYMSDQAQLYMIESDDDVTVENPSSPSSWVYGVEFFDGYLFIMDVEGTIYNGLNAFAGDDAMDFSAPDTLTVGRGFGGIAVCLKAFNNYILAFKRNGLEFFYDAGNATGSPLSPYRAYASDIGCVSGATVARTEETVLWVGQSTGGGVGVYLLDGLKPKKISTYAVDKILEEEGTTLSSAAGFHIKVGGHYFYILSLNTLGRTLVYDITENQWEEWGYYVNEAGTEVGTDFKLITTWDGYSQTVFNNESYYIPTVHYCGADTDNNWWLVAGESGAGYGACTTFSVDTQEGIITRVSHSSDVSGYYVQPIKENSFIPPSSDGEAFIFDYGYSSSINVVVATVNTTTGAWTSTGGDGSAKYVGEYQGATYNWVFGIPYSAGGIYGGYYIRASRFNGTDVTTTGAVQYDCSTDIGGASSWGIGIPSGMLGNKFFVRGNQSSTSYYLMYYTFDESNWTFRYKLDVTSDVGGYAFWKALIDGNYIYVLMNSKIIAYSYLDSSPYTITKLAQYTSGISSDSNYCDWALVGTNKIAYLNSTYGSAQLSILTFNGSSFSLQASYSFTSDLFASNASLNCNNNYILVAGRKNLGTVDPLVLYLFYAIPSSTFKGAGAGNSGGNKALVLDSESGAVYQVDSGTYDDNGEPISTQIITDKLDGATNKNKVGNRLEVIGDYEVSSGDLEISWSDDDYKTYSTARTVDVDNRMILSRLGRFQRRAFKLVHEEKAPLRLEALELEYDLSEYGR